MPRDVDAPAKGLQAALATIPVRDQRPQLGVHVDAVELHHRLDGEVIALLLAGIHHHTLMLAVDFEKADWMGTLSVGV
ncbi:MAG: hypothetical protein H7A54_12880 [Akkermansiaceae bacterium]|nr:hypothetical protein [Akkermansiaceae bacterium]